MMADKKIDDGGPAFARSGFYSDGGPGESDCWPTDGMSLRDWFAGKVLGGFMSAKPMQFNPEDDAAYCYKVADAMIAARKGGA